MQVSFLMSSITQFTDHCKTCVSVQPILEYLLSFISIKRYSHGANAYIIIHVHTMRNFKIQLLRGYSDHIHMSVKLNNNKFYTLIIYIPTYISKKMF